MDQEPMMLVILALEEDGAEHDGAEIDAHVESLGASAKELSEVHSTGRSVFGNRIDWAKAKLTEKKFHEVVGKASNGQNVYRITLAGRDFISANRPYARA